MAGEPVGALRVEALTGDVAVALASGARRVAMAVLGLAVSLRGR